MKTPTAALAASLLMLGATAHADGGLFPIPQFPGAPSAPAPTPAPTEPGTPAPAAPGAPATPGTVPPVGVQPVPNTPVESLPEHADHADIAGPGPQPGVSASALTPAPTAAFSREWVVSPSGNDSGDGSAAQPFRTISKAITQANPGEVVRVLAGTYNERVILGDNAKAGTPEAKITLQGEGRPRIVPGNGGGALVQVRRPNWVIDGFDVDVQG